MSSPQDNTNSNKLHKPTNNNMSKAHSHDFERLDDYEVLGFSKVDKNNTTTTSETSETSPKNTPQRNTARESTPTATTVQEVSFIEEEEEEDDSVQPGTTETIETTTRKRTVASTLSENIQIPLSATPTTDNMINKNREINLNLRIHVDNMTDKNKNTTGVSSKKATENIGKKVMQDEEALEEEEELYYSQGQMVESFITEEIPDDAVELCDACCSASICHFIVVDQYGQPVCLDCEKVGGFTPEDFARNRATNLDNNGFYYQPQQPSTGSSSSDQKRKSGHGQQQHHNQRRPNNDGNEIKNSKKRARLNNNKARRKYNNETHANNTNNNSERGLSGLMSHRHPVCLFVQNYVMPLFYAVVIFFVAHVFFLFCTNLVQGFREASK